MPSSTIVWDIETVPDLLGFAAANALIGRSDDEVRAEMGDKFPKLIYHSIVCIGALVALRQEDHWAVSAVGAPNIGERPEREIISAFVKKNRRVGPSAGHIQRGRLRPAGPAQSGNGLRGRRARAGLRFTVRVAAAFARSSPTRVTAARFRIDLAMDGPFRWVDDNDRPAALTPCGALSTLSSESNRKPAHLRRVALIVAKRTGMRSELDTRHADALSGRRRNRLSVHNGWDRRRRGTNRSRG